METKDWILLLVPIISNGVLLVIFQEILKRRFEKLDKKRSIEESLNQMVFDIMCKYDDIIISSNRETPDSTIQKIDNLGYELWGLQRYVKAYNLLQEKYGDIVELCLSKYNIIVDALKVNSFKSAESEFDRIGDALRGILNDSIK